jgi:hypothetical protein
VVQPGYGYGQGLPLCAFSTRAPGPLHRNVAAVPLLHLLTFRARHAGSGNMGENNTKKTTTRLQRLVREAGVQRLLLLGQKPATVPCQTHTHLLLRCIHTQARNGQDSPAWLITTQRGLGGWGALGGCSHCNCMNCKPVWGRIRGVCDSAPTPPWAVTAKRNASTQLHVAAVEQPAASVLPHTSTRQ